METSFNGSVYGIIERLGLATTQRHVGDGTLVLRLASRGDFSGGLLVGSSSLLGRPAVWYQ